METFDMPQIDLALLEKLPVGLMLVDADDHVAWINDTLAAMLGTDSAALAGQPLGELPASAQHLLDDGSPLVHIAATRRWASRSLRDVGDGRRLLVAIDRTTEEQLAEENARLHQQVEDLKLTDELTGLPNKRAISQALELHVSRSRRYQNPLSVVLVHVDLGALNGVQPLSTDPVVLAVSRFLRDRLRWVDQIARWEDNVFLLVLPETSEEDARSMLDKVVNEQSSMPLPDEYAGLRPTLGFGLACWKKGDDMRTLLRTALQALREGSG